MDIGYLTSDAAKYPSKDWKKVIILEYYFCSVFDRASFFNQGLSVQTLNCSIAGVDDLPDFDDWGKMFIDGLKVFCGATGLFHSSNGHHIHQCLGFHWFVTSLQSVGDVKCSHHCIQFNGGLFFLGVMVTVIFGVFFTIAFQQGLLQRRNYGSLPFH